MIYLKLDNKPTTFSELLLELYGERSYSKCYTYKDEECTVIQCSAGSYRSVDEIFEIARTYFPEITFQEVQDELKEQGFTWDFCFDIEKIVLHKSIYGAHIPDTKEEFRKNIEKEFNDNNFVAGYLNFLNELNIF